MSIKFRVEYEITPIRYVEVYCPNCNEIFDARENGTTEWGSRIYDDADLQLAQFSCPKCATRFRTRDEEIEIEEIY